MIEWYECSKCGRELPNEQAKCKYCGFAGVRLAGGKRGEPINLNTASKLELQRLGGFGPVGANAVIARRRIKPFTDVAELQQIRTIGKVTYEKVKSKVYVRGDEKCYIERNALLKRLFPLGVGYNGDVLNYTLDAGAVYRAIMAESVIK